MKKTASHLPLLFLALALLFPAAANAGSNGHVKYKRSSVKETPYMKHQEKLAKKQAKQQQQAAKKLRKQHNAAH